jgi:hypothetical protein
MPRSATRRRTAGESRPVIDDRRDAALREQLQPVAVERAEGLELSPCSPM